MSGLERFARHRPDVLRMRAAGMSYKAIERELPIAATTAWRLADDEHEQRYQASTLRSAQKRLKAAA